MRKNIRGKRNSRKGIIRVRVKTLEIHAGNFEKMVGRVGIEPTTKRLRERLN